MNNAEKEKLNKEVQAIYNVLMEFDKKAAEPVFKDVIAHPYTGRRVILWIGIPLVITCIFYLIYLFCHDPLLKIAILATQLIGYIGFMIIA